MCNKFLSVSLVLLLLVVLMGAFVPLASADPGTQTWYLTSDNKPAGAPVANDGQTHAKNNLMHKGSGTGTGTSFNLPSDEVAWFYSDTGAECDLSFGANSWTAWIRTEGISGDEVGKHLTVEICKLGSGTGDVTVLASHSEALTEAGAYNLWEITCEDNGSTTQDFATGDWLAIRLSWDYVGNTLSVYYKNEAGLDSYIQSPSGDPGYPVPELPTIVLLFVGLLVLGGYVWARVRTKPCRES